MDKRPQHTPGPWTQEPSEEHSHVKIWGEIPSSGAWLIAEVRADHRFENDQANADLIAAAPDLLAACEALHNALSGILESAGSPYRDMTRPPAAEGDYLISRYDRAAAILGIRKSFKALVKAKGEP